MTPGFTYIVSLVVSILRGAKDSNIRLSILRTLTPIVAGAITSYLVRRGLDIDEAEITAWLTPALSAAYYVTVRLVERVWSRVGWLLGSPAAPAYQPSAMVDWSEPLTSPVPVDGPVPARDAHGRFARKQPQS